MNKISIKTKNSIYHFFDRGDGAFLMESNNKDYTGPVLMKLHNVPTVGERVWAEFLEGSKKGRTLITTEVVEVLTTEENNP